MKIFDLFSKRQKRKRGELPDVYQYEEMSRNLRFQIINIWDDAFGYSQVYSYQKICKVLRDEYGEPKLWEEKKVLFGGEHDWRQEVCNFFLNTRDIEKVIDVIELSCSMLPKNAIDKLNRRFQEHGVGYQFESGEMIRLDSQWPHAEIMQPAMHLLSDPMYQVANAEFMSAHKHYREKNYEECLIYCLRAFESCLKVICKKRKWGYDKTDSAKRLIDIVFERELIPKEMQSHFSALKSTLESGVPTARNRMAAHGQGDEEILVPEHIAGYVLYLTASNILLLAKANEAWE